MLQTQTLPRRVSANRRLPVGFAASALNRKRWTTVAVAVFLAGSAAKGIWAQGTMIPSTNVATPQYGGIAMPAPVPYQPTLDDCSYPADEVPWTEYPSTQWAPPVMTPTDVPFPMELPSGPRKPWFPPGSRQGFFQKVKFTGTYLPRFEDDSLGMSDLELDVVLAVPFFTRETPLLITPFYGVHFIDGPDTPDVPPRLHDAAVTLQNFRPLSDTWMAMFDITLGQFADDSSFDSSDAFRITGGGAGVYRPSDHWKWVLGATYVNRANTDILPVVGFIYTPNDDAEYRLVFPAPRIAWRLPWTDVPGQDERWFYIAGEFGGGAWAVERTSGASERLDITDWRIYVGLERKIIGGLSRRVELGYVFARTMEYSSAPDNEISLDDTLMLRAGLTY